MNNIKFCVRLDYNNGEIDVITFDNRTDRDMFMRHQLVNGRVRHIGWFEDDGHTQTTMTWLS